MYSGSSLYCLTSRDLKRFVMFFLVRHLYKIVSHWIKPATWKAQFGSLFLSLHVNYNQPLLYPDPFVSILPVPAIRNQKNKQVAGCTTRQVGDTWVHRIGARSIIIGILWMHTCSVLYASNLLLQFYNFSLIISFGIVRNWHMCLPGNQ